MQHHLALSTVCNLGTVQGHKQEAEWVNQGLATQGTHSKNNN